MRPTLRARSAFALVTALCLLVAPSVGLAQFGGSGSGSGSGGGNGRNPSDFSRTFGQSQNAASRNRWQDPNRRPGVTSSAFRTNALGRSAIHPDRAQSLLRLGAGRRPVALLAAPQFRAGVPRGANAASLTTRRGTQVYTVRQNNGRAQRFTFAPPSGQPAPIQVETEQGDRLGVRVVAFDIDGTLIDTRQTIADGIRAGIQAMGAPVDDAFVAEQTRGKPYGEVAHNAVEHYRSFFEQRDGQPLSEARVTELRNTFFNRARDVTETSEQAGNARAYPGARQLVRDLQQRNVRVVAVTSRPTASALSLLRQAGLDRHFDVVVGRQERRAGNPPPAVYVRGQTRPGREMDAKPSPASLLYALRLTSPDAHPSETVFVGDMHTDLRSADGGGATPIAISHGMDTVETLRNERPAVMVSDIAGLRTTLGLDRPATPTRTDAPAPAPAP